MDSRIVDKASTVVNSAYPTLVSHNNTEDKSTKDGWTRIVASRGPVSTSVSISPWPFWTRLTTHQPMRAERTGLVDQSARGFTFTSLDLHVVANYELRLDNINTHLSLNIWRRTRRTFRKKPWIGGERNEHRRMVCDDGWHVTVTKHQRNTDCRRVWNQRLYKVRAVSICRTTSLASSWTYEHGAFGLIMI